MDDNSTANDPSTNPQIPPDDNAPDTGTPPVYSEDAAADNSGSGSNNSPDLSESFPVADANDISDANNSQASGESAETADTGNSGDGNNNSDTVGQV